MICGVYEIWIGDKFYQGSSKHIEYRITKHKQQLISNKHVNKYMQNAFNKYKIFEWHILVECEDELKFAYEQDYIDANIDNHSCLNISHSANGGCGQHSEEAKIKIGQFQKGRKRGACTDEHKQKLSEAMKGRPSKCAGIPLTNEHRQKLSEAKKGRPLTNEHRQKLSDAIRKKYKQRIPMSEEQKQKRSESAKKRWKEKKKNTNV